MKLELKVLQLEFEPELFAKREIGKRTRVKLQKPKIMILNDFRHVICV